MDNKLPIRSTLFKILEMFVQALNYHLIDKKSWLNFLTFSFIISLILYEAFIHKMATTILHRAILRCINQNISLQQWVRRLTLFWIISRYRPLIIVKWWNFINRRYIRLWECAMTQTRWERDRQTDRQTERKYMCLLFSIHLITLLYYYTCIYFWINFITKQFLKK